MNKIAIIGAGGLGREVKSLILDINNSLKNTTKFEIIGFFDDNVEKGTLIHDLPVLGSILDINKIDYKLAIVLGIGSPIIKKKAISLIVNKNINYPSLIHPTVLSSNYNIQIGEGVIIAGGCILTCDLNLANFITLNIACTVGHDSEIHDFCSFMPSVNISGEVKINKLVYVGTGATIINQVEIGENTIIGAGAVVTKSLPENCTAVGAPAKPIKFH